MALALGNMLGIYAKHMENLGSMYAQLERHI